jgi:hypothetical protein
MSVFDDALDAIFSSPLAVEAMYQPQQGEAFSVRTMPKSGDVVNNVGGSRIRTSDRLVFDVPAALLPQPAKGDGVTIGGVAHIVKDFSSDDSRRLIWTVECQPV